MIILSIIYIVLGSLLLVVYRLLSVRSIEAEREAIERIAHFVASGGGDVTAIGRRIAMYNLVQCVVFVAEMTTEQSASQLRIIVRYYHIENYLLSRIRKSRSTAERAYLLSMLSRLPISLASADCAEQLATSAERDEELYATMCLLPIAPVRAVSRFATAHYRLSRRDVAEILSMVSRGQSPLPYTPLLLSETYNLQLLGIHLVRRFGIAESRTEIVCILKLQDDDLREDALSALASFGEQMTDSIPI